MSNVDKKSVDDQLPVRLCNYTDVYYRDQIRPDQEFMAATATVEQVNQFRLRTGDVLITKDSETADDIAVPSFVAGEAPDLVCGYHLAVLRPHPGGIDPKYLYWSIVGDRAKEQFSVSATGVTRYGLRQDEMGRVEIDLPSLTNQRAIARYLDTETARIDALVAAKQDLMSLLADRLRLLAWALTTQSERTAPLRRAVMLVKTGSTPPASEFAALQGEDIAWYSPSDVGRWLEMNEPSRRLARRSLTEGWVPQFPKDSTVIIGIGATAGRVGHLGASGTGNQQMTCLVAGTEAHPRFLSWQLMARTDEIRETAPYTTLPIINNDFLRSFTLHLPDLAEQARVAGKLDDLASKTKTATAAIGGQLGKLVEHRQALITAAVAGELEIPGVAP